MLRRVLGDLDAAVTRRLRSLLLNSVAILAAIVFGCVSLGFATLAAYFAISLTEGRIIALIAISALYSLIALAVFLTRMAISRQSVGSPIASPIAATVADDDFLPILLSMADPTFLKSESISALASLARGLSGADRISLAIAAGLLVGRRLHK